MVWRWQRKDWVNLWYLFYLVLQMRRVLSKIRVLILVVVAGLFLSAVNAIAQSAKFSKFIRLLHIYSSMLVLILLLFFAATGITLNHPEWQSSLGAESKALELKLPGPLQQLQWTDDQLQQAVQAEKIALWLRDEHQVQGAVFNFSFEPDEQLLELDFKRPAGYSAVLVELETGRVELSTEYAGTLALLNDLHKGRYAGSSWKWLIDLTAVACLLFGISGFYLLWRQPSRRRAGVNTALFGLLLLLVAYLAALH